MTSRGRCVLRALTKASEVLEVLFCEALNCSLDVTSGWSCPSCTFINKSTRPGCEICSTDRPNPPDHSGVQQEKARRLNQ